MEVNKNMEYAAARKVIAPSSTAHFILVLRTAVIRRISAKRFKDGGAAIFLADSRNHQKVIDGNITIRPFDRNSLRELVEL